MAIFFPKITLEEISQEGKGRFSGKFTLDISERFNMYKEFEFIADRFGSEDCSIIVLKDEKVFLRYGRNYKGEKRKKYLEEQKAIFGVLHIILYAYLGKLDATKFALTKIESYGGKLSVTSSTADWMGGSFVKACI